MSPQILHIIGSLATGGAETAMVRLCCATQGKTLDNHVLVFGRSGPLEADLLAAGVPVFRLRQAPRVLSRLFGAGHPPVFQGWMYHGCFVATTLQALFPRASALAWNIRCGLDTPDAFRSSTRTLIRLLKGLSGRPDAIVYNAHSARTGHEAFGFRKAAGHVIPNGFDLGRFCPDPAAGPALRTELGLPGETLLAGLVARVHPEKNPGLFLRAIARLGPSVHAVLVGPGAGTDNPWLMGLLAELGLADRVHLLGERRDVSRITAGLDLAVSASWNEGFSNAIGEALACGIPCVATAVGDSPLLVGQAGRLIPPGDEEAMADALRSLLALTVEARFALGQRGRTQMLEAFGLEQMADRYQDLYSRLVDRL